jgi:hypothetical protein
VLSLRYLIEYRNINEYSKIPQGIIMKIFVVAACKNPPTIETAIPNKIDAKRFEILVFI